jgi:hypothetical protein
MHSAAVHDLSNVVHEYVMKVKFYMLQLASWEGKSATLPFQMTNTLHLKSSQYQILVLSFLPLSWFGIRGSKRKHFCSNGKASNMFIFSRMHCVCKQKQIYFFPFGDRITDVLVLCVLYFPEMQHTEELWICMVTVSGGKDGRRYIPVYNLCSSLSNITCQILPSLHALTGCDTTSAFIRIGKK